MQIFCMQVILKLDLRKLGNIKKNLEIRWEHSLAPIALSRNE